MPRDWPIVAIGFGAGLLFRRKGFAVPVAAEVIWWIAEGLAGKWTNTSGNGDNLGAIGFAAAAVGTVIGTLGVLAGVLVRALIDRAQSH